MRIATVLENQVSADTGISEQNCTIAIAGKVRKGEGRLRLGVALCTRLHGFVQGLGVTLVECTCSL